MMPEGRDLVDAAGLLDAGDGDAAADGGLDEQAHAVLQGAGGKLGKMGCDHSLVGGHHVLSGLEGAHDEGVGRLDAAHAPTTMPISGSETMSS